MSGVAPLSAAEARVLGSLVEKAVATPDYYPLTLNALTNACNQLTNRDPVVSFDEADVVRALDSLRDKRLATLFHGADSRVPKYKHTFTDVFVLMPREVAVLCVLLLRGPQTVGELRTRTERLHPFASLAEVEEVLNDLATRTPDPLVVRLPRQPGTKESRYAHLLSGSIESTPTPSPLRPEPATVAVRREDERLAKLEEETAALRRAVADLKQQFAEFKKQFE